MVYLDYSATTPVDKEVLASFDKASLEIIGNANSNHKLGRKANLLMEKAKEQIIDLLHLKDKEIIYTSGASEANNLAIKGIAFKYLNRGKHIITSYYEHSSVKETLLYLKTLGFEIDYLETKENGVIDLEKFKTMLRNDTILVTINAISSELGLKEPIKEMGEILKDYPKCFFHVDLTQGIGKVQIPLDNVDLATLSAHKIYGLKGIGALIKRKNVELTPLIHGGKSTTIWRSGTPSHPLVASLAKALRLILENEEENFQKVKKLNIMLQEELKKYPSVYINSNEECIPHILNVSIIGVKAESFMHALEAYDIYVSTKSACSDDDSYSESVYHLTKDLERAKSSIRISISHLTTEEDIKAFLSAFSKCYHQLKML